MTAEHDEEVFQSLRVSGSPYHGDHRRSYCEFKGTSLWVSTRRLRDSFHICLRLVIYHYGKNETHHHIKQINPSSAKRLVLPKIPQFLKTLSHNRPSSNYSSSLHEHDIHRTISIPSIRQHLSTHPGQVLDDLVGNGHC
jgi:hypothetical protein